MNICENEDFINFFIVNVYFHLLTVRAKFEYIQITFCFNSFQINKSERMASAGGGAGKQINVKMLIQLR